MRRLVNRAHSAEQKPELEEVFAGFSREAVKNPTVRPDFAEAVGPHPPHHGKHAQAGPDEPRSEQESESRIEPRDVVIGVVPDFDSNVGKVDSHRLPAFCSGGTQLLLQRNILLDRGLDQELTFALQIAGKFLYVVLGDNRSGFTGEIRCNCSMRANAVEHSDQLPLQWREAKYEF